jgi:hypothetical protein
MSQKHARFFFLNLGHAYDHLFMLLFPTVVLALGAAWLPGGWETGGAAST